MFPTTPLWFRRAVLCLMLLAVLARLTFWSYTHRTWEDALITVLHSENAASGLGLTHLQPAGQPPLHGFTSPLSVLIPLVGDLVHVGWGVEFLKLVSALISVWAVWLVVSICLRLRLPYVLALTAAAFVALEHHQILWGMAGMETEVVTSIYLFSVYALIGKNQWAKGISLGLLMLARPDAAMWVSIIFAVEIFRAYRVRQAKPLIPVAAGLLLLYAPWLIFTTLYYGSPVPNTIIAKGLGYQTVIGQPIKVILWVMYTKRFQLFGSLAPSYSGNGTGNYPLWNSHWLVVLMLIFFGIGLINAIWRKNFTALLVFAPAVLLAVYLLGPTPVIFGWYTAPVLAMFIIGCVYGLWQIAQRVLPASKLNLVLGCCGAAYILWLLAALPITFRSDKAVQAYVDGGVREQMALDIHRVAMPSDTVGSESLGYVGYYTRLVIYDYPGLCSRNVVRYLRDYPAERDLQRMVYHLQPTFIVIRPSELEAPSGQSIQPWLQQNYDLFHTYSVSEEDRRKILQPERNKDFTFYVFHRKDAPLRVKTVNPVIPG